MCYIHLLGVEYRNLIYIQPHQDVFSDIRHKTPSVKTSAIYLAPAIHLLLAVIHPNLLNRTLLDLHPPGFCGRMFMFQPDLFLSPPFPLPSCCLFPPLFCSCLKHHSALFSHHQVWRSLKHVLPQNLCLLVFMLDLCLDSVMYPFSFCYQFWVFGKYQDI